MTWQGQRGAPVRVWGERVACGRAWPQWQWPPTSRREPVWGWRGVLVALWTRRLLRRKGKAWWVSPRAYQRLEEVLTGRRHFSAALLERVGREMRDQAVRRSQRARPMQVRVGGGLGIGWRR